MAFEFDDLVSTETSGLILQSLNHRDIRIFADKVRGWRLRFAHEQLKKFIADLVPALANAASVERALINFEHLFDRNPTPQKLLKKLVRERRLLKMLTMLFAGSQFLTEIVLRYPAALALVGERENLKRILYGEQFYDRALAAARSETRFDDQHDALRRFQQLELLRIGCSDLFGFSSLPIVVAQLSNLAIALVRACLMISKESLKAEPSGFAVIALGKLGGRELNYSSDIDLIFIARSTDVVFQRLGRKLIDALSRTTACGFLYRVDMRLRPWGGVGRLAPSLEEALSYFKDQARIWEKQALVKARMIAGDDELGVGFLRKMRPEIYALEPEDVRAQIREMKEIIEARLKKKGVTEGEVKNGPGSIRDVEFVTQYLQLRYGARFPEVRSRNTLDVLARLSNAHLLSEQDYRTLSEGYTFLRTVEHHLQVLQNRQIHTLPRNKSETMYLARRMGFAQTNGDALKKRYKKHSLAIRDVYRRYILADAPPRANTPGVQRTATADEMVSRHVRRMNVSYAAMFASEEIAEHARLAEKVKGSHLAVVKNVLLPSGNWRLTLVGYDYLGALSLICGLLYLYDFDVLDAAIFTYERDIEKEFSSRQDQTTRGKKLSSRRKLVDVFTLRPVKEKCAENVWERYTSDLRFFMNELKNRKHNQVYGALAKRMAAKFQREEKPTDALSLLIDVSVDNTASEKYTMLRIDAPDTVGFLYAVTNALSLNGVYIARMNVSSKANRAHDTLFVTDAAGAKISDPTKRRQLQLTVALIRHFFYLLPNSPNPESAILHFRALISQLFSQEKWVEKMASLERPEVMKALARLLGVSDFLWEDFLRLQHENLFPVLNNIKALKKAKSKDELDSELSAALESCENLIEKRKALNAFKDREIFRIDMRYIQVLAQDYRRFSTELSDLVEAVVEHAFQICFAECCKELGRPTLADGNENSLVICALGKFGGREIGCASDIELLFIYRGDGATEGPRVASTSEFYTHFVTEFKKTIQAKKEGVFELDLRLRPWGRAGSLAIPLNLFESYYGADGPAWPYEKQSLIRLRPVSGDKALANEIVAIRDRCVYQGDAFDAEGMYAMRERQLHELVEGGTFNAKFSRGGLVDLEFLVQGLQIKHGGAMPEVRQNNTFLAMQALNKAGVLSQEQFQELSAAYLFLSRLIEALRMVRGNAKDLAVPTVGSEAFSFLARRLDYFDDQHLQEHVLMHTLSVRRMLAAFFPESTQAKVL